MEQGTHDELLAVDGVYRKLVLRQLMSGEEGGGTQEGAEFMGREKIVQPK